MLKILGHRIGDRRVLRLVRKWLTVGVGEEGKRMVSARGTPQGAVTTPRTQKQTWSAWRLMGATGGGRAALRWGRGTNGNAMPDDDGVVANEDVLDDQAHDSLALNDVERVSSAAQTAEERRKSLGQTQERGAIGRLVGDCLQLDPHRLFTLPQRGHPLTQLFE